MDAGAGGGADAGAASGGDGGAPDLGGVQAPEDGNGEEEGAESRQSDADESGERRVEPDRPKGNSTKSKAQPSESSGKTTPKKSEGNGDGGEEKPPPRKYKLKVSGKEQEATKEEIRDLIWGTIESELDADPERAISKAQLAAFAHQKMGRAQELSRRHETFEKAMKDDPASALAQLLGGDEALDSFAENRLRERLRQAQLSPSAREEEDARTRLESLKAEEQRYQQQQHQRTTQAIFSGVQAHTMKALEAQGVAEAFRPGAVQETGRRLQHLHRQGYQITKAEIDRVVGEVAGGYTGAFEGHLGGLDDAAIMGLLGDRLGPLSRAYTQSLTQEEPSPAMPPKRTQPRARPAQSREMFDPGEITNLMRFEGMSIGEAKAELRRRNKRSA